MEFQKTPIPLPVLTADTFERNTENICKIQRKLENDNIFCIIDNEDQYLKYFPTLSLENKFSKSMYFKTSQQEKDFAKIIANKPIAYMQEIKSAQKIADSIKCNLDTRYGKNNYSILGIGRSPVIITELIKLHDVKSESIPFTHGLAARNSEYKDPKVLLQKMDWKKYFAQFGFDKKILTDKNKKTIAVDFVFTGNTISYFQKMMDILYPNNNIKYVSIADLTVLPENVKNTYKISDEDISRFLFAIEECDYKQVFSTCPHLWSIEDYKRYNHADYKYPLFTKIILLNYMDNELKKNI